MAATGTPTPNIGLRIPLGTDPASVDDINYNSNLLDTKLGAVGSDSVQDQIDTLNGKITEIKQTIAQATFDATGMAEFNPPGTVIAVSPGNQWADLSFTYNYGKRINFHSTLLAGLTTDIIVYYI